MRKEILYAIVAGSLFGLVIAFGIWKANNPLKSQNNEAAQTEESLDYDNEVPQNTVSGITIAKPSDNQVFSTQTATISGITSPDSFVVLSSAGGDYLVVSDEKGAFEEDVKLVAGINNLLIYSVMKTGEVVKTSLTLVYSSSFETEPLRDENPETSTDSADSVRKAIEAKIADAKNTPTSYIGTVTDMAKSTVEIRKYTFTSDGKAGEIQQIATNEETTYAKDGTTPKEIKLTDIAIGDFIIAMGYKNGNNVLDTKRILVVDIPSPKNIQVSLGKIQDVSKTELGVETLPDLTPQSLVISKETKTFSKEIKAINVTSYQEGDFLVIITETDEDGSMSTRSLFLVELASQSPSPTSTPESME